MLKWLAMLLMILDHVGYYFYYDIPAPAGWWLRAIGRLSFPIFAYMVAVGYSRTRNKQKYFWRMLLFACLTQLAFVLASQFTGIGNFVNVMFTFALAIIMMGAWDIAGQAKSNLGRSEEGAAPNVIKLGSLEVSPVAALALSVFAMLGILFLAFYYNPDYNIFGVLTVLLFYLVQQRVRKTDRPLYQDKKAFIHFFSWFLLLNVTWAVVSVYLLRHNLAWSLLEIVSTLSVFLFLLDLPRPRPPAWEKYFFYVFYPVHIVLLMLLSYWIK